MILWVLKRLGHDTGFGDTDAINKKALFLSNAYWVGVMVSCECEAVDRKQLHLCSTCVLRGSKSCVVIWAFYSLCFLSFISSGGFKNLVGNDDIPVITC